ncbi:MAG: oxaloacetate decarboxylase [Acutalibacteraceae bacterium]
MTFNPMNFITNLRYLAVGMISIFIVIGVIILVTVLLNKIFTRSDKK